jgi:hypothetical protein
MHCVTQPREGRCSADFPDLYVSLIILREEKESLKATDDRCSELPKIDTTITELIWWFVSSLELSSKPQLDDNSIHVDLQADYFSLSWDQEQNEECRFLGYGVV